MTPASHRCSHLQNYQNPAKGIEGQLPHPEDIAALLEGIEG